MPQVAIEPPEETVMRAIGEGLRGYNSRFSPTPEYPREFVATLRDAAGALLGGLTCNVYRGGMLIEWAWIDAEHRGQGHGRALIAAGEAEGARRGAAFAHLDTFTFQARGFYERCGYAVLGVLDYPGGVQRFYMRKTLTA